MARNETDAKQPMTVSQMIREYDLDNLIINFEKVGLVVFSNKRLTIEYVLDLREDNRFYLVPKRWCGVHRFGVIFDGEPHIINDYDTKDKLVQECSHYLSKMREEHNRITGRNLEEIIEKWQPKVDSTITKKVEEIKTNLITQNTINQIEIKSNRPGYSIYVKAGPKGKKHYVGFEVTINQNHDDKSLIRKVRNSLNRFVRLENMEATNALIKPHIDRLLEFICASHEYHQFVDKIRQDLNGRKSDRKQNAVLMGYIENMKEQVHKIMELGYSDAEVKEFVNEMIIERIMAV